MLDAREFAAVWKQYQDDMRRLHPPSKSGGTPDTIPSPLQSSAVAQKRLTGESKRELLYRPLQDAFEKITGLKFDGSNPKVIMHYRISFYGAPCPHCGRLLRNPRAKQCFECGMDWHDPDNVLCRRRELE